MLHIVLYTVEALVIAACFIFSLRLINKKVSPSYMKFFLLYPVLGFLFTLFSSYLLFFSRKDYALGILIINVSKIFHYFILSILIYKIQTPRIYSIVQIFVIICGWISLFYTLIMGGWDNLNFKSQFTANLALVILCLFYFGSLLNNLSLGNLKKDPGFWIIVGVVFGMGVSLPLYATLEQLFMVVGPYYGMYFNDFTLISFSVMYLSFIKAIRCTQTIQVG